MMASTEHIRPLAGHTVAIVGPGTVAQEFLGELEHRGAVINILPAVVVAEPERYERLDEALDHLYGYDWLLFTNPHGVEYFLDRLRRKEIDADTLDDLKVCAIGEETEERLRLERVHVDVVPPAGGAIDALAALSEFLGGAGSLSELNFLAPRATVISDDLSRALIGAGARVDLIPAYSLRLANGSDPGREAAMLAGGTDSIILTDPASVTHLKQLFDTYDLRNALAQVSVSCFDEVTAKRALGCGLKPNILPANPTAIEFADAVANHCGG
ncbi:MAG TPA: uroporphyrinogen-III synthase [Pyrinomonadaceae bacterium]|nr:uroporphyrinogen-III synthase [Pyrinomonadaceae bacterium]